MVIGKYVDVKILRLPVKIIIDRRLSGQYENLQNLSDISSCMHAPAQFTLMAIRLCLPGCSSNLLYICLMDCVNKHICNVQKVEVQNVHNYE